MDSLLNSIVEELVEVINYFRKKELITDIMLTNYEKCSKGSLHSILQYVLIVSGIKLGLAAIPEFKINFKTPLDPSKYISSKKRRIHFYKADVGFIQVDGFKLVGIGEVYTIDMAHSCYKTGYTQSLDWITARIKLPYMLKTKDLPSAREIFVILLVTLPKNAQRRPKWKDQETILAGSSNYYEKFSSEWRKFTDEIRRSNPAKLVILTEKRTIIY